MTKCTAMAVGLVFCTALGTRSHAIVVDVDFSLDSNNFFGSNPQAEPPLRKAANIFEQYLDTLDAISPGGSNTWDALFTHPGTGAAHSITDLSIPADTVKIYVGGRSLGGPLGIGGPGGFSAGGTQAFVDTVAERGEPNASGVGATDFGPWGGSISFDSLTNWNFSVGSGPSFGENDFLSTALHEFGHALGFASAQSFATHVSGTDFIGPASVAEFGGNVPLEPDTAHWEETTMSVVGASAQEAAMDPTLTVAMRKLWTDLDYASMTDIGWQVPEPTSAVPLALGALGLLHRSRRRRLLSPRD